MRATALITAVTIGTFVLAPVVAQAANVCTYPCVAYAADNGGGPAGPNYSQMDIPVTAHVGTLCQVITAGSPPLGADFGATVDLHNLADGNGHLLQALNTSTSGAAAVSQSFQVICTGVANAFTLKATPLADTSVDAPAGYANTVNYTAEVNFLTTGSVASVSYAHTSDSVQQNQNLPAGVGMANVANNVTIKAYQFTTGVHTDTDILVHSDTYQALITVTISAGT